MARYARQATAGAPAISQTHLMAGAAIVVGAILLLASVISFPVSWQAVPSSVASVFASTAYGNVATPVAYIAPFLVGGLGNQLFGVAAALEISRRSGAEIVLGLPSTSDLRYNETRHYKESIFSDFRAVDELYQWAKQTVYESGGTVEHYSQPVGPWGYSDAPDPGEQSATAGSVLLLHGYFQHIGYFGNVSQELRAIFKVPERKQAELLRKHPLASEPTSWAIHVRRGDYVTMSSLLLSMDYFEAAVKLAGHTFDLNQSTAFLFSDDIEWCKTQPVLNRLPNVVFVNETDPVDTFHLLRLTARRALVCSNSTFCWWAAFLSHIESKSSKTKRLVVFPEQWAGGVALIGNSTGSGLRMDYMTLLAER